MKLQTIQKGFTLIELLVVITIIGILATGAVSVYTSQIQKARDTTRINDVKALQAGIEQSYQDQWVYPNAGAAVTNGGGDFATEVRKYTPKLPKDPKTGQKSTNASFDYAYAVASDTNGIGFQIYEVSTTFENTGNITTKGASDNGNDDDRYEAGISVSTLKTNVNRLLWATSWVANATPTYACETPSTTPPAATTTGTCPTSGVSNNVNAISLIIK